MMKQRKYAAAAALMGLFVMTNALPTSACTAVYVGADASADGTIMLARCNDYPAVWPNYVTVYNRVEGEPGRTMPVDEAQTVFADLPETTYQYTATPWMDSMQAVTGHMSDCAACVNEYGVSMTMSVTAFANEASLEADPRPSNGLTEDTANDLVICQSRTAREAVEVLCGLIDTYGSAESNIALISDQTEAWYVEMYTGHQYAAVLLPSDKVAVFGNEFGLEYLSDYEDSIASPELLSLAEEHGFAVFNDEGEMNLLKTYSADYFDYSHMRTWIGHQLLAPSGYGDYQHDDVYPLVFSADDKVSLQDVMELMRNRYEGTEYSPDETDRPDVRVIGTDTTLSAHILQTYPDLPAEIACVTWESVGPDLYGVFVPVSNGCTSISESYSRNQTAEEAGNFDSENYPWYAFKELCTLCLTDYQVYGEPVRAYWKEAEAGMIQGMSQVLETAASMGDTTLEIPIITDYCAMLQEQAFSDAKSLLNDVIWYMSENSNTFKVGINPETHEQTDELKTYAPLEVGLDASAYAVVPN